jgi:NAD(P)-dependent dehydrogenase (short-subunit alcohol dehydrogenase family)
LASALFDLTGKVAIITGGTRGLGLAIAEAYLDAGASVMICSEDAPACEGAKARLQGQFHDRVAARACDVTSQTDQRALVDDTLSRFGGLDILVANAGIPDPMKGSLACTDAEYRKVMSVNLDSVVQLCGLAVPPLRARGGGSIVLMASLAGLRGNRMLGVYALSKAALIQLARNLAIEFGPDNIRANAIAPGFIRTDLAAGLLGDQAFMARRMQNTPLRRPGEPHEVAGAALFLAGRGGAFVTGQTLVVDGGTLVTDGS